jgi:protein SCO1/2
MRWASICWTRCLHRHLLRSDMRGQIIRALTVACTVGFGVALALVLVLPVHAQGRTAQDLPDASQTIAATIAPRYLLMGANGRSVTSENFRGRLQLIAFGFVSCPDVCPTTMLEMSHVLAALGARAQHVQPIFITVDPQRDTAQVLGAYTQAFDPRILGLTGPLDLVRRAADNFKVQFAKVQEPGAGADVYTIDHTAGMFLLGSDGVLIAKFGYGAPVAEITEGIQYWLTSAGK